MGCKALPALQKLFEKLTKKYSLDYNLRVAEFRKIMAEANFRDLDLPDQQRIFCEMLDLNQLYVCRCEADDTKYGISPADCALTAQFYGKSK